VQLALYAEPAGSLDIFRHIVKEHEFARGHPQLGAQQCVYPRIGLDEADPVRIDDGVEQISASG